MSTVMPLPFRHLHFGNPSEHFQKFLKTLKGNDRDTFRRRIDFRIHWR